MSGQYYLSSAGERWPEALASIISRFEFEAGINRISRLTLTIRNEAMTRQDDPLLAEGQELTAQFGSVDRTTRRTLRVHQVRGTNVLTVPAYGPGADLAASNRWRLWGNVTFSEIAHAVARVRGLQADVAPDTVRRQQVTQAGETDAGFLTRIAGEIGWEFWVDDRSLHFRPPDYGARPVLLLQRGMNVDQFDPQEQTLAVPGEIAVRSFALSDKEYAEVVVHHGSARRISLGPASLRTPAVGRLTAWTAAQDSSAATQIAFGAYEALERHTVTARFRCAGDIRLMPGAVVQVEGYGSRWDGLYRVALARHQIAGTSYIVEGYLHRNAAGRVGTVTSSAGTINRSTADMGRPFAVVRIIDLATGEEREEEVR